MAPKGSGSQASTLVARGSSASNENKVAAARPTPTGTVRRRTPARSSAQPRSGYFYTDDTALIKLSPTSVIIMAVAFIVFVFILHIFGKLRGA